MLFQHAHIRHDHAPVDGLAHVVDGQQADLHGGQRFHFHARLARRIDLGAAVHAVGGFVDVEVNRDARERQRVAQGNQIAGALGAHDGGDAGDAQHVAFFCVAGNDQGQGGRLHADAAGGHGAAARIVLAAHIDHMGLARSIEMGQFPDGGVLVCSCHGIKSGQDGGRGMLDPARMSQAYRMPVA